MGHLIQNFDSLARTPLRHDALAILEAGYDAVNTHKVIREEVTLQGDDICVKQLNICVTDYERVYVIAIGKCAVDAAQALEEILGLHITDGVVLDVKSGIFEKLSSYVGSHPFPTTQNVTVTESIASMLRGLTEKDFVITVISGGGSSLLCLPYETTCETLHTVTEALMQRGASIQELNTVRKHLSDIQGGQLAQMAYPATVLSLILSDVPGNDMSYVASGPTVLDDTTKDDALRILQKYAIDPEAPEYNLTLKETPKDPRFFANVHNILVSTNERALGAMAAEARARGYSPSIVSSTYAGENTALGIILATTDLAKGACLLYGGETTITVHEGGTGGRNQALALTALPHIDDHRLIVAAASDGWDNSDAAGALADLPAKERAQEMALDPQAFLARSDSYEFWRQHGDRIVTGKTGINVADFYFVIKEK